MTRRPAALILPMTFRQIRGNGEGSIRSPFRPVNRPDLPPLLQPVAAFWRARVHRHGRGGWLMMLGFAAVVAGSGIFLACSESPWDRGIPGKLGTGQVLTIRDTIVSGLWLGAAINAGLGLLLLTLAPWWARPLPERSAPLLRDSHSRPGTPLSSRWFWALTLLAVVAAAAIRAPRLTHSFWNDEEQAFRKFTWGEYEATPGSSDLLEFDPAGWDRALFYSVNGNNHVFHTVCAKLCHSVWSAVTRPDPENFREWVIRLEPFVSGLLALVVIAVWLRRAGFPVAGVTAAWLLAIHPWVLRYAVEARGYSAMLLFILLAFLCATEAMRTGLWRWWIGFGLAQCLYLLCFAGAVYLAVAMNLVILALIIYRRDSPSLWRWLMACVAGAMLFLQIMTATVMRIWNWVQAPHLEPFPMDASYLRDFVAHLTLGVPWSGPEPTLHLGTDVTQLAAGGSLWALAFRFGLPALVAIGIYSGARRSTHARLIFGVLAITAGLIYGHNLVADLTFFGWYALYLTLGLVIALAFVAETWQTPTRSGSTASRATAFAVVALYAWLGLPPLSTIRAHDRHPMRQAVIAARGEAPAIDSRHADVLTAAVGSGANQLHTYDPRVQWIKTEADLSAAVARAREAAKPLIVYACGPKRLGLDHPAIAALLNDATRFDRGDYLPGQEEFWSFQIYRLRPAD
jgi:hypothetical protein